MALPLLLNIDVDGLEKATDFYCGALGLEIGRRLGPSIIDSSRWEFDRIYFYLVQEKSSSANIEQLVESVEQKFEKLRSVDGGSSLDPLHYAIRALKKTFRSHPAPREFGELSTTVRELLTRIEEFLTEYGLDKGQQIRDNIKELRTVLVRSQYRLVDDDLRACWRSADASADAPIERLTAVQTFPARLRMAHHSLLPLKEFSTEVCARSPFLPALGS